MGGTRKHITRPAAVLSIAVLALSGCVTEPPTTSELQFGAAVKNMRSAQLYSFTTAMSPDPDPVAVLNGRRAGQILNVYHTDVSKPQEIKNEIQINVGN